MYASKEILMITGSNILKDDYIGNSLKESKKQLKFN